MTAGSTPPIDPADPRMKALQTRGNEGLTNDVINEYVSALQRQLGVSINEGALQTAEGS